MRRQSTRKWMIALAIVLAIGLLLVSTRSVLAPRLVISAGDAASCALAAARDDGLGGYVTPPEKILGMQMNFEEALQTAFGAAAVEDHTRPADYPVWLVVLEGKFIEHVPAAPPDISARDVEHSQMVLFIDAHTGDAFESVLVSPQHPLDTRSLPALPRPNE